MQSNLEKRDIRAGENSSEATEREQIGANEVWTRHHNEEMWMETGFKDVAEKIQR